MPTEKKWEAKHHFVDIGEPLEARNYQPRKVKKDPEAYLAAAFGKMGGRTYAPIASGDTLDALARKLCLPPAGDGEHDRERAGPSSERQNSLENSI
jgi:hypothetical protein